MINEKQIEYLLTVAEEHNITAAARRLYISQPALSRMILDIESQVGMPLFVRDRKDVHLTQAGEIYLRGCRDVLTISRSVTREIADIKDSRSGRITLGVTSLTGEFLLPSILDSFEKEFPGVVLDLQEARMKDLREMIRGGKADMALVYDTGDDELDARPVLRNPVYIQVPPHIPETENGWQPGSRNPEIDAKIMDGQPFILLKKGRGMRDIAERFFLQTKITPGKITETENIHLASSLVCMNRGFSFVPGIAVRRFGETRRNGYFTTVKDYPMARSLYICFRRGSYLSSAEKYLIELIASL